MARAFLSIQSSSTPVERLFSDSGVYEGSESITQNLSDVANSSIEEMLFTIRSHVQWEAAYLRVTLVAFAHRDEYCSDTIERPENPRCQGESSRDDQRHEERL